MRPLDGRTAIVTGAGRGLGRAIAIGIAEAGAAVWVCARTASELEVTAQQISQVGGSVHVAQVDLSTTSGCEEFVQQIRAERQEVDVLVNNAAVLDIVTLEDLSTATWHRTLAVNLTAPFLLIKAFLPQMKRRGGSIINVSSRAGVLPFAGEAAYCASKYGLEGFTKSVALELQGTPVSINTMTPGLRIKPTSVSDEDVATGARPGSEEWHDPALLTPAFVFLASLRGRPSGMRFDAHRVAKTMTSSAGFGPDHLAELAE